MEMLISVVVPEGISLIHLAIPCTIFGDRHPGGPSFELNICALTAGHLPTTVNCQIVVHRGLGVLKRADVVIVPSWPDPVTLPSDRLLKAVRAAESRGAHILGLCLGAYVLAHAGLLDGKMATTHWAFAEDFMHRFPKVRAVPDRLYVKANRVWTSAGVAAGFDCCLEFVRWHHGAEKANAIARNIVVAPHRAGGQTQFIDSPIPLTFADERLDALMRKVRKQLHRPHSIQSLSSEMRMSRRTFTRHFHAQTGTSLGDWLVHERVRLSQRLLETTDQPVDAVAQAAGIGSPVTLRSLFQRLIGVTPTQWRATFRGKSTLPRN